MAMSRTGPAKKAVPFTPGKVAPAATPRRPPPRAPPGTPKPAPPVSRPLGILVTFGLTLALVVIPFGLLAAEVSRGGGAGYFLLMGLVGLSNLVLLWFTWRKDPRAWGGILILDALLILIALGAGPIWLVVPSAGSLACLYFFRLDFSVGAWRIEEKKEAVARELVESKRTANPAGIRCRNCGGVKLWIAPDGSAVCLECKTGITRAVPPPA